MMCIYIYIIYIYISCIYRMYGCISTPVYLLQYCTISSYPSIGDWSQASDLQSASSQFLVRQKEPQRPGQLGGFDDHGDTLWLFNIAMEIHDKWRFLAGKIICKWAMASIAMLNNQRVSWGSNGVQCDLPMVEW